MDSAVSKQYFLSALSTVGKLAPGYEVTRLIRRLAREYQHAAGEGIGGDGGALVMTLQCADTLLSWHL